MDLSKMLHFMNDNKSVSISKTIIVIHTITDCSVYKYKYKCYQDEK